MDEDTTITTLELILPSGMSIPFSEYWAVDTGYLGYMIDMLQNMSTTELLQMQHEYMERERAALNDTGREPQKPYKIYDNIAHIPFSGMMTKRPTCMGDMMGAGVSTVKMRQILRQADQDSDVKSKMLIIDSPGGEVAGAFDLAHDVLKGHKPTDVFYEDLGASAALLVGSGGRNISANKNASVGSVGVYTSLKDTSQMHEKAGAKIHVVKAGRYKAAGHPGTQITEDQLQHIQSRVDEQHGLFLRHVLEGRPRMTKAQLADVADAGVYIGEQAVKAGLVDKITSLDKAHANAVKSNSEARRTIMAVDDATLKAWLSPDSQAAAETVEGVPPATVNPPQATVDVAQLQATVEVANLADPMLTALAAAGVTNLQDLRGLVSDALMGREALAEARATATRMAAAAYNNGTAQGLAAVASAERYIADAPIEVVRAAIDMYTAQVEGAGLAAAPGSERAVRFSAPAALNGVSADAPVTPPKANIKDMTANYAESIYGSHAKNGKVS